MTAPVPPKVPGGLDERHGKPIHPDGLSTPSILLAYRDASGHWNRSVNHFSYSPIARRMPMALSACE